MRVSYTFLLSPISLTLRKPNKFYTKWLFLFVRYFAVAMQMSVIFALADRPSSFIHYFSVPCCS